MASYHFSVKSKNKGYAISHYLYISRLMQYDGIRKTSNEKLEHIEPGRCMPAFVKDPIEFWQAADSYERANAKAYIEYEIALPNEFTPEQRKTLIETFLDKHIVPQQYPHSYAIHNVKSRISGEDQPHCHLMFSLKADDGVERTAEQYFKRYNAKDPAKGGVKKIQLQDGHQNYSEFLLFIRKAWENHLNDALAQHCPTVTYHIDGQDITIKNQVSAGSYDQYNELHGTMYIPEPKLGVGKQNETEEYLADIQKIRLHNAKEREMEQKQRQQTQKHEHFYSCLNEPYTSLEVMYYLNYLAKKAKNQKELKQDFNEIIKTQKPMLQNEHWNLNRMDYQLKNSLKYPDPQIEFNPVTALKPEAQLSKVIQTNQHLEPTRPSIQPKPKNDDYDFGGP
ncbi:plasmid mobilization protein [Acinetobacter pittii]|uniref:MobA/MobL family protein n=1 Tax=Acinetobacter calcoaceticus/baumannii complex TaxID=909768 RepID=UPI00070740F8|nr:MULTISPECIES: MobA/MobL family protein [Acinetobacter calcoaceticus/baumannii complex]KQF71109.1 plasmid mobilization protein [Acinetobacter baumannii]KQF89553.1 plasmid mobilization protein [Acinetobacter pittii]KRI48112.1 plasmid mobilization protein [Acinetobacter pittii]MCK0926331.1 MobA/MobL family protein [Acinetobacter pittii]MCW8693058.1 MobA/MobL family protein [Acinetobacter baumannii]